MRHSEPPCCPPECVDEELIKDLLLSIVVDVSAAIRCALTDAGFIVGRQVNKTMHHPVYEFCIRRTYDMEGQSERKLKQQIRKALRTAGLYKNAKENFMTFTFRAQKIVCGLVCKSELDEPEPEIEPLEWMEEPE